MRSHGWAWRELDHYTARICEIGVHGMMLYDVEGGQFPCCACMQRSHAPLSAERRGCDLLVEDILEHDLCMHFRLHRRVLLDAIQKLRVGFAQPCSLAPQARVFVRGCIKVLKG